MCGISGIINLSDKPIDKMELEELNNKIIHRGPDSEGFYINGNVGFGFRRLAILDLSPEGNQPMSYGNNLTIIFNGEVYNYIELRDELIKLGFKFSTNTDTEVILAAYSYWGEECVTRFNGMWAFAIHDSDKNIIFASRDRFGVKPFYYRLDGDSFRFGSEIKQILHKEVRPEANIPILMDYLVLGFVDHSEETFFKEIKKLPASHCLRIDLATNKMDIFKYFELKIEKSFHFSSDEDGIKQYDYCFRDAIKLRLRSDVNVGTCLSGGMDSSSIAGIASNLYKEKSNQKFMAIHAQSTEIKSDESQYAKMVATHCDLNLLTVKPSLQDFQDTIDELIRIQEEPFGSTSLMMQYYVMKTARENNCTVLLDGQGGDESLLGYERYFVGAILSAQSLPQKIKNFIYCVENSKLTAFQLLGYLLYFPNYIVRKKLLSKRAKFIKPEYLQKVNWKILQSNAKNFWNLFDLQEEELFKTQLPALLRYEDKNSMRHSIEARLPFLDYRLVQLSLNLPIQYKNFGGWSKYVLRKVVDPILPKEVVWRKNKIGFEAPTSHWSDAIQKSFFELKVNSEIYKNIISNTIDYSNLTENQKWRLFNLLKWEKLFNIKLN
jgi:asparagine synthase (glutamine-hydrolysing)